MGIILFIAVLVMIRVFFHYLQNTCPKFEVTLYSDHLELLVLVIYIITYLAITLPDMAH